MRIFFVCLLLLECTLSAVAQTELDPVTITSTLQPINSSVTGRNIVVIKGEQFQKLPVHSVDELLRYIPGLEVQMRGPLGAQSDIVLRGGTFQQVLVLIDGMRLNDPNTGHFSSYVPITPAQIDRVEVLKGASSAVYGSEAVGGVINIVTKTFAAKQGDNKKNLTGQFTAGEHATVLTQVGGEYQNTSTAVDAGFLTNHTLGEEQRGTNGFVHNTTASASVSQFLNSKLKLSFRSSYDRRDFSAQNFYTTFTSDTANENVTTYWNQLQLAFNTKHHSASIDVGYKDVKDQYQYNAASIANANKSKLFQTLGVYNWQPAERTTITAGVQWINKQIVSNDRGDHHLNQVGTFALLHQQIGNHFYINPALRLEWNQSSGTELVPQLNASYKLTHWQLRASTGKTIRDADFTERYNNNNKPLVTGGSIGNPDLLAERSWSYEAGADYYGLSHIKISVTGFTTDYKRLIDYVVTPYDEIPHNSNLSSTGTFALAKNIADITNTGVETDIQYTQQFAGQQLWFTLGFTYIHSRSNQPVTSFYLSSHANVLTNFNLIYSYRWLQISLNGIYKSRDTRVADAINAEITKNYFVLNSKLSLNVLKSKLGLFVEADNTFDKKYSDLLGAQMPGRWMMGGVSVTLK